MRDLLFRAIDFVKHSGHPPNCGYSVTIQGSDGYVYLDKSPLPDAIVAAIPPNVWNLVFESDCDHTNDLYLIGIEWSDGQPKISFWEEAKFWRPRQ